MSPCAPRRLKHRHFLKAALRDLDVSAARRFVAVLPRAYADARTYNLVVSVCAAARDVPGALATAQASDELQRRLTSMAVARSTGFLLLPGCGSKSLLAFARGQVHVCVVQF
jgi:hypothetical protein